MHSYPYTLAMNCCMEAHVCCICRPLRARVKHVKKNFFIFFCKLQLFFVTTTNSPKRLYLYFDDLTEYGVSTFDRRRWEMCWSRTRNLTAYNLMRYSVIDHIPSPPCFPFSTSNCHYSGWFVSGAFLPVTAYLDRTK